MAPELDTTHSETTEATQSSSWLSPETKALIWASTRWYLVNRVITTVALFLSVSLAGARFGWRYILETGDGRYYLDIAKFGYFDLPRWAGAEGERLFSSIGFFPLMPTLIRVFDTVLPGDRLVAGMVVSFIAGWGACLAVTFLAREIYGDETARRAAALIACFPGVYIFSFIYTEGLLIIGAATALILLRQERWVWAGLAGAFATAARPSGVAIVVAAAVVAAVAIYRKRDWASLAAPAIAVWGMASYLVYLWIKTDNPMAWFENQRDFWHQKNNPGGYVIKWLGELGPGEIGHMDHEFFGLIVIGLIPVLYFFYRYRPDLATTAYVTASLIITLSSSLGPRPRFLLAAFPLLLPFAHRWKGERHTTLVALGFGLLPMTLIYYAAGAPLAVEHFHFFGPVP